jgi:hypothetical protein
LKNHLIKKMIKLLLVCLFFFVILKLVDIVIYVTLTQKHLTQFLAEYVKTHNKATIEEINALYDQFSSPITAKMVNLIIEAIVVFFISFVISKMNKYQKKYWASALIATLIIHNIGNSNFAYTPKFSAYLFYLLLTTGIGILSIYMADKMRKEKGDRLI